MLRGDSGPVIVHADHDRAVFGDRPHLDLVARHRVFGRVRKEIEHQLPDALPVGAHGGQRLVHLCLYRHLVVREFHHRGDLTHELTEIDIRE